MNLSIGSRKELFFIRKTPYPNKRKAEFASSKAGCICRKIYRDNVWITMSKGNRNNRHGNPGTKHCGGSIVPCHPTSDYPPVLLYSSQCLHIFQDRIYGSCLQLTVWCQAPSEYILGSISRTFCQNVIIDCIPIGCSEWNRQLPFVLS